jgi:hypothetical protein
MSGLADVKEDGSSGKTATAVRRTQRAAGSGQGAAGRGQRAGGSGRRTQRAENENTSHAETQSTQRRTLLMFRREPPARAWRRVMAKPSCPRPQKRYFSACSASLREEPRNDLSADYADYTDSRTAKREEARNRQEGLCSACSASLREAISGEASSSSPWFFPTIDGSSLRALRLCVRRPSAGLMAHGSWSTAEPFFPRPRKSTSLRALRLCGSSVLASEGDL